MTEICFHWKFNEDVSFFLSSMAELLRQLGYSSGNGHGSHFLGTKDPNTKGTSLHQNTLKTKFKQLFLPKTLEMSQMTFAGGGY